MTHALSSDLPFSLICTICLVYEAQVSARPQTLKAESEDHVHGFATVHNVALLYCVQIQT